MHNQTTFNNTLSSEFTPLSAIPVIEREDLNIVELSRIAVSQVPPHRQGSQQHSPLERLGLPFCRFTPRGRLLYANQEYCSLFGIERHRLDTYSAFSQIHYSERKAVYNHLDRLAAGHDESSSRESLMKLPLTGEVRHYTWHDRFVVDSTSNWEQEYFEAVGYDSTEKKYLQSSLIETTLAAKRAEEFWRKRYASLSPRTIELELQTHSLFEGGEREERYSSKRSSAFEETGIEPEKRSLQGVRTNSDSATEQLNEPVLGDYHDTPALIQQCSELIEAGSWERLKSVVPHLARSVTFVESASTVLYALERSIRSKDQMQAIQSLEALCAA